ncbi:hypothetical protein D3C78_1116560 [compost metagenome]
MEPVGVFRVLSMFLRVYEWRKGFAGMIEDSIEQHADAAGMTGVHQLLELFIGAKVRVDLHIVLRVIFMIRRRLE